MSEQQNRQTAERYFQALANRDLDMMADTVHEDFVEEYPQSGERIRGKQNWRTMMESYPGMPTPKNQSFQICGDLGVAEALLEYPNGETYWACSVFEFKDGKILRSREFFGAPFEAPQWRSRWVEKKAA